MAVDSKYSLCEGYTAEVDTIDNGGWTEILGIFSDATLYQTWSYGKIHWNEKNLSHLILKKNGCIVAAAQVYIMKIPLLGFGIAYIAKGPLWRIRNKESDPEVFQQMIRALCTEYSIRRNLMLRITPNEVQSNDNRIEAIVTQEGFQRQLSFPSYPTIHVDLGYSLEELMKSLGKRWREKLRRAQRNDLEVVEGTDENLYDVFHTLFNEMHSRKKYVNFMDIDEFRAIQLDLPDIHKMKIMVCKSNGESIAALVWSVIGDTGVPVFSATGNKGLKAHGSYLLRWGVLERLKELGCVTMDQGGVNAETNPGGYHFKKGMGGTEVSYIGSFDYCESNVLFLVIRGGFALREHLRRLIRGINKVVQRFIK